MRETRLKVNSIPTDVILAAGGSNFKLYFASDDRIILKIGAKVYELLDTDYKLALDYINIKYLNKGCQYRILEEFNQLLIKERD